MSIFDDNFFFETKEDKLNFFKTMHKINKEVIILDENKKEIIEVDDITNKIYTIINAKNMKQKIEFNPFDYITENLINAKNFQDLVNMLSDVQNFSLYKFYKENRLLENVELNQKFKENIQEMLSSKTINELFGEYASFNDYICPYHGKESENFINQTFDITYYIPIPFQNIAGFTYKSFGIIFISNINRFEQVKTNSKDKMSENMEFCRYINKISFLKVVHIHEIISHYSSSIIHSNNNKIPLSTPIKTFKNYNPLSKHSPTFSNMDERDKGEAILLGNKIKYIYTNGALFIINNNNYKKNLEKFRKEFVDKNTVKTGDILDLAAESKNSPLLKEIVKQFFSDDKNRKKCISLGNKNVSSFRIVDRAENQKVGDEYYDKGVSFFEQDTHIFPKYQKMI